MNGEVPHDADVPIRVLRSHETSLHDVAVRQRKIHEIARVSREVRRVQIRFARGLDASARISTVWILPIPHTSFASKVRATVSRTCYRQRISAPESEDPVRLPSVHQVSSECVSSVEL